jgi:hypothetical protein
MPNNDPMKFACTGLEDFSIRIYGPTYAKME